MIVILDFLGSCLFIGVMISYFKFLKDIKDIIDREFFVKNYIFKCYFRI